MKKLAILSDLHLDVNQFDENGETGFSAAVLFKSSVSNKCEGFDGDPLNPLKAVIKYGGSGTPSVSNWFYIVEIATGLDIDGDETKILKGISKGTTVEYPLNKSMNTKYGVTGTLKVGDVFLYGIDKNNEIANIAPIWSKDQSLTISDTYNVISQYFNLLSS